MKKYKRFQVFKQAGFSLCTPFISEIRRPPPVLNESYNFLSHASVHSGFGFWNFDFK